MKLQKILALCLANLTLFSTVAFANPPGKEKQEEFENYFQIECEEAKKVQDKEGDKWHKNMDKRSDIFDRLNQEKYTNVLEMQKLYAKRQNEYHDCCCRFNSADLSEKLTELGFENYELLAVTDPENGEYHLANLYKDCNGNWAVADLLNGVNHFTKQTYKESAHIAISAYLQGLARQDISIIYVKNKPSEKFADEVDQGLVDIRVFSAIYEKLLGDEPIKIPTSIYNNVKPFVLKTETKVSVPRADFNTKLKQIIHDYNLDYLHDLNTRQKLTNLEKHLKKNKTLLFFLNYKHII